MRFSLISGLFALLFALPLAAQYRVDLRHTHERLVGVVPLIGAGTKADPKRPLFAPRPGERSAILAYSWQPSDDGRFAVVEFVARDAAALAPLLGSREMGVRLFRKGKTPPGDVAREMQAVKRNVIPHALSPQVP